MQLVASPLPETVNGVPLHPLVVHAVVVLLPLAILGAIGISVWPAMRRYLGLLVVLVAFVGLIFVPVATSSGEAFRARLGAFQLVRQHASYAEKLLPLTAVLVVLLAALMVVDIAQRLGPVAAATGLPGAASEPADGGGGVAVATRPQAPPAVQNVTRLEQWLGRFLPARLRDRPQLLARAIPVLGVLTIAVSIALAYYVYKTGDSGAKAVWQGR